MTAADPPAATCLRFAIPAIPARVDALRQRFLRDLGRAGLGPEELEGWKLVFSESLFNAIEHGAANDPSREVRVEWALADERVILAVEDPGRGLSDEALANPSLPEDPASESGRGVFIMAQFADRLTPWRGPRGFRLEIERHYPGRGQLFAIDEALQQTLEELSACYESLSAFHSLANNLIHSGDLHEFIDRSLAEFVALNPLDRIFIQGSPAIPSGIRRILKDATWFLDPEDAGATLRTLGTLTRETVWQNRRDLIRQGLDFDSLQSVGAGCVFPIVAGEIHFGALIAFRRPQDQDQAFRSLGSLRTLADLCGMACANTHLEQVREDSRRDLQELEIAVDLQKALLPILPPPTSPRWAVSIHQEGSLRVAGDYAIARLDPEGNLVVAIIDVMGKGVSAALLASIFRTAFELVLPIPQAADLLNAINRTLCEQLGSLTMFITCAIARVSADGRLIDHASAGHCPTILLDPSGSRRLLEPSGPPLGLVADISYTGETLDLRGGERLVFVTDGCYEWDRQDGKDGWTGFLDLVESHRQLAPERLWQTLRQRISASGGEFLEDDCTLMTLDLLP